MSAARRYLRQQVRWRPPRPLDALDLHRVRQVLLLNFTALGDLLFSTPAIRALKETYPHWRLDLLVKPQFASLMETNPHIHRLWRYPGRGLGLLKLMQELKQEGFDLTIILHGNDPEASLLARAAGSPFIIGSAKSPLAFAYSAGVLQTDPFRHAIEHRLDFVRLVGADTGDKRMEVFLHPEQDKKAEAILLSYFGFLPPMLLAIHPSAREPHRCWPLERFAEIGRYLWDRHRASFLIICSREERPVADALAANLPGQALVTGGLYDLVTTASLLKHCQLFLGNDSGPFHLALALKVPSIALLSSDHPLRIGPYQVDWGTYLYQKEEVCGEEPCLKRKCSDNRCLQAIQVPEVIGAIKTWWEPRFGDSKGGGGR